MNTYEGKAGEGMVFTGVCLSVSVFPHDVSKTYAARITKLDIEMFHCESWKPIYFGVKKVSAWVLALL